MKFVNIIVVDPINMGKENISWEKLILELKSGKMNLLGQVYSLYKTEFVKFAHRYRLNNDQVLEVYQNSILILYENIIYDKIKSYTSSIKTYLFSVGKNQLLNEINRGKKKLKPISELEENDISPYTDNSNEEEENLSLKQAFEKIGENCKELLVKSYYQGISNAELLAMYKYKNDQTLRSHKSRCLKKLRIELIKLKNK